MRINYLFILLLILTVFNSFSQSKFNKYELVFKSENDSFLGTSQDRYYTNGLFINFRSAIPQKNHLDTSNFTKKIWSLSAGQKMYNAISGKIYRIENVDRPFAAYLYAGSGFQWLKSNENSKKIEIQFGIMGPSALGQETQTLIHDTFGFYEIDGWEFQLKDEIGFNAVLNLHYLLKRSKQKITDFSLPIQLNIGNTFSGLSAGILFRAGLLNPFYHSIANHSNVSNLSEKGINEMEYYLFLKPSLDIVVYNATISGGLFRNDKGPVYFNANPLVFTQEVGLAYANKRWTLGFSAIFKSKELKEVIKSEQYGSIDIYYRF